MNCEYPTEPVLTEGQYVVSQWVWVQTGPESAGRFLQTRLVKASETIGEIMEWSMSGPHHAVEAVMVSEVKEVER